MDKDMEIDDTNMKENFKWEFKSIIKYILANFHKFLLLLSICVIIYGIDYVTHKNALIYGIVSIPGIPNSGSSAKRSCRVTIKPSASKPLRAAEVAGWVR